MAAKLKFKKLKNNNPFPLETLQERHAKEKAVNKQSQYSVDKIENGYILFKHNGNEKN